MQRQAHLFFAGIALMVGNTNLVEEAVELADDGGYLLRQVASVHGRAGLCAKTQLDDYVSCNTAGGQSECVPSDGRADRRAALSGGLRQW